MNNHQWVDEFRGAIKVCDANGVILEMNDTAAKNYEAAGGKSLIGKNLFDCHPEPARTKLKRIMDARRTNVYTIEKKDVKKLIYQSPWYENGEYRGFVELSLEIPFEMPHFVRDRT
jgi:transcriptional regulator with PAS, ATPase and Fis domain